jgi:hypothetical protein
MMDDERGMMNGYAKPSHGKLADRRKTGWNVQKVRRFRMGAVQL